MYKNSEKKCFYAGSFVRGIKPLADGKTFQKEYGSKANVKPPKKERKKGRHSFAPIYRAVQLNEDTFFKIVWLLLKSYTMHLLLIYLMKLSKFLVLFYKLFQNFEF